MQLQPRVSPREGASHPRPAWIFRWATLRLPHENAHRDAEACFVDRVLEGPARFLSADETADQGLSSSKNSNTASQDWWGGAWRQSSVLLAGQITLVT
jgi:hypothetical protein